MNYRFWKSATKRKQNQILKQSCPFPLSDQLFFQVSYQNLTVLLFDSLFNLLLVKTMVENSKVSYIIYTKWQWQKEVFTIQQTLNIAVNLKTCFYGSGPFDDIQC